MEIQFRGHQREVQGLKVQEKVRLLPLKLHRKPLH